MLRYMLVQDITLESGAFACVLSSQWASYPAIPPWRKLGRRRPSAGIKLSQGQLHGYSLLPP